jgi:putative transposase
MRDSWLRSRNCFRRRLVSAGGSHKQRNVLNAIPRRERGDVQAELVGIWEQPTKQEALVQLETFKAKYSKRYPEAVRSLAEEEEKTLTFYAFPLTMHRHIQTTNAIESL